jgi:hypothetical protein
MALYISRDDVALRLKGKVRFTEDEEQEDRMPIALLDRLINEAEGDVEHDLSPRYSTPFVTDDGLAFKKLPARPTAEILRTLCELKACIRVLETDFGSGTVVDAEKYSASIAKRYEAMVGKLLEKKKHGGEDSGWKYPPLPSLKLNYMNTEADDGYMGQVLVTSRGHGDYPAGRINDPGETFFNATYEDSLEGYVR